MAKQNSAEGKVDLGDLVSTVLDAVSRVPASARVDGLGMGGGVTVGMVMPGFPNINELSTGSSGSPIEFGLRTRSGESPIELLSFAQNAGTLFERIGDQASARSLPTTKRAESLATMQKLGVLTQSEGDAIGAILAKGDSQDKADLENIISDVEAASATATSPTATVILNCIHTAVTRQQSAEKLPRRMMMMWDWSRAGDGCVEGGSLGAIAGAEVGGGWGLAAGAVIGCLIGGGIKGATGDD
jgi:hypothetical protein